MADALLQVNYTVRLLSPVLLTNSVGDENISLSHDYLPGSSLLGMFASLYIREHLKDKEARKKAHGDPFFAQLFLSDRLRFLNGYALDSKSGRTLPAPRSLMAPKAYPDDLTDTLFDKESLPDREAAEKGKKDKPNTPSGGFCTLVLGSDKNFTLDSPEIKKAYHFHHQRTNQLAGRNVDGMIFNYEALERDQIFSACLIGDAATLKLFQDKLGGNGQARLGRSKNTEYGLVEIDWRKFQSAPVCEAPKHEEIDEKSFVLTMLSDAILLNRFGHSEAGVSLLKETLAKLLLKHGLPLAGEQLDIEKYYLQRSATENYVAVWRARKPSMSAFAMGSCFKVVFNPPLDQTQEVQVEGALQHLQSEGLGIRKNEGFGRVAINWQKDARIGKKEPPKPEERKNAAEKNLPKQSPPTFQTIIKTLLWNGHRERAKAVAAQHLNAKALHAGDEDFDFRLPNGNRISGAQMSRLQRFAVTSSSFEEFEQRIKALPKTTRDQVFKRACNQDQTLWDFLTANPIAAEKGRLYKELFDGSKYKNEREAEQALCHRAGLPEVHSDPNFLHELFRLYMATFFTLMSKKEREEQQ